MAKKVNPKSSRNENLYVFSHEHHHGLIFAVRIRKAHQADAETLKRYIEDFWDNSLIFHFDNEEKLFLNFITDAELKERFLSEHKQIRTLYQDIKNENIDVIEKSKRFGILINDHIRFEERILFPWLQENLTSVELKQIGTSLHETDVCSHEFSPRFWEKQS
jgi:hemerythrin-like domain-containing protein